MGMKMVDIELGDMSSQNDLVRKPNSKAAVADDSKEDDDDDMVIQP